MKHLSSCLTALALAAVAGPAGAQAALPPPGIPSVSYVNGFVLQNDWGLVRLYPRISLALDVRGTAGAGAAELRGSDGGPELSPRVVVRRGLAELGGGAFGFLDMDLSVEIDGRGTYGDRLLPGAHDMLVGIPNAWINAEAGPALNLMVGIQPTPFSLEHRTDPDELLSLEQSVASQLAVPFARSLGATVWGTTLHKEFGYDLMWIAAVGDTAPTSFAERGGAGRIFYRPYGLTGSRWDRLQIGVSGRWTVRDGQSADLSRVDVTTGNGFALWDRRYVDSLGRTEAILPSGNQRALGVEVLLPTFKGLDFTGEVYVFDDNTREAVESAAATSTERLGSLQGAGWYGELSYLVAPLVPGQRQWTPTHDVPYDRSRSLQPGLYPHPRRREAIGVPSPIDALAELQFTLRAGRVDADYQPVRATNQPALYGQADAKSPGGRLDVWQVGGTVSLWWTRIFRLTAGWESYCAPGAGTPQNRATLPAQLAGTAGAPWMHEFTLRARMAL